MKIVRWMSILSLSVVLAGSASAQSKLESVEATKSGNGVVISVHGTKLPTPKVTKAFKGKVYLLDFHKSKIAGKKDTDFVGFAGVKSVKKAWYGRPPHARVTVYLTNANAKPTLAHTPNGWTFSFGSTAVVATNKTNSDYDAKAFDKLPPLNNPIVEAAKPFKIASAETVSKVYPQPKTLSDVLVDNGINVSATKIPTIKPPVEAMVSLDFSNTELILILRAIADQTNTNIVSSPDVSGRVSVSLDNVTLTEALNLVTTIANVRYTKIGKTYLVTSSARFSDAIRQVVGKLDEPGETKVIQLRSGEGKQIKAATLKALPQLATDGYYDLILPTEKISAKTSSGTGTSQSSGAAGASGSTGQSAPPTNGAQAGGSTQGGGAAAGGTSSITESQGSSVQTSSETEGSEGKDTYVLVVANPERMKEVTNFIEMLDMRIAKANSISGVGEISTKAIMLLSPNDDVIVEAVKNMADRDPRASSFKISVTNAGIVGQTNSQKMLVISGPSQGVEDLAFLAESTDRSIARALGITTSATGQIGDRVYEVLDLKWVEPAYAMTEIQRYIRGIAVSMMPAPVEPGGKGSVSSSFSDMGDQGNGGDKGSSSGAGASGQGNVGASVSKEDQKSDSKSNVTGTEAMKLLVYGTKSQIDQTKSLLAALDIEPKQVAFELRVLELSKDDILKAGLDWSVFTGAKLGTIKLNNAAGNPASTGGVSLGNDNRTHGGSFAGVLDQITTKNNLISRPNTIATDGRTSHLFVGDTVRYVESFQQTQNGLTVTVGKVNTGVALDVTPRVGADGTMSIHMTPSLSILRGFTNVVGGGQLPQTSDRRADLVFNMQDGETIALGGLITDQDKKSFGGVPILRDLPLIGRIFGRTENTRIRTEVVFFVTAHIVNSKNRASAADPRTGEQANPIDPTKINVKPKVGTINP